MEQALKTLEPSQNEIRLRHLNSLAENLSHARVPPEEEASLSEALHFCTQEEKENLMAACRKQAHATTKRRAAQAYEHFPWYLPAHMWETLHSLQNRDRMEALLNFLFKFLWLRCPSEQTLAMVVAVCQAMDGGIASSFHLHEQMGQARSVWKSVTSKNRTESEVPEFVLTLPTRKQDASELLKRHLGLAWDDRSHCPFTAPDLESLAKRVPLRKTNAGSSKNLNAFMQNLAHMSMCANPAGSPWTVPTGIDPRQAGPLTNLIIYPPRRREEPKRALSWSEPAVGASPAAQPPLLALPAPEASVATQSPPELSESFAERSAAVRRSTAEKLDAQDSLADTLPPGIIELPTSTKEEERKLEVKSSVKPEAEDNTKPEECRAKMADALREKKAKAAAASRAKTQATGAEAKAQAKGKAKAQTKGKAKAKAKGKAKAGPMKRPAARNISTDCAAVENPPCPPQKKKKVDSADDLCAGDPEGAGSMCGTGNVFFHSSVYGQCKGEFYKAKSYLRHWQDSDKKWKMIVGSCSPKHEELCRRLVPLVRAGWERQALVKQRDAWDV